MVDTATVLSAFAAGYAAIAVAIGVWSSRVEGSLRRVVLALAVIPVLGFVSSLLTATGLGTVVINGNEITASTLGVDLYAYPVLYGLIALLAAAPRRLVAAVVGVGLLQRLAFTAGSIASPGSLLATLAAVGIFGGFPVLVYLYVRPVWRHAQSVDPRQRLVHWKARNFVLFVFGMLVLFAVLFLVGVVQSQLGVYLTSGYANFFLRGVLPAFLAYKLVTLDAASLSLTATAVPQRPTPTE